MKHLTFKIFFQNFFAITFIIQSLTASSSQLSSVKQEKKLSFSDYKHITPIFDFAYGEKKTKYQIGFNNKKFIHENNTLGAYYLKDNEKNQVSLWFSNSNFYFNKLKLETKMDYIDDGKKKLSLVENSSFYHKGRAGKIFLIKEILPWISFGAGVSLRTDSLEKISVSDSQKQITEGNTNIIAPGFLLNLGIQDKKDLVKNGGINSSNLISQSLGDKSFINFSSVNKAFAYLSKNILLAMQGVYNITRANDYLYQFNLNDSNVRGYGSFLKNKKSYGQSNIEFRISPYKISSLDIASVFFVDALTTFSDDIYASLGAGLRFDLASYFCLRFDCAYNLDKKIGYVIGVDQMF